MGASASRDAQAYFISEEVTEALRVGTPVVALESAVITHGLPFPTNVEVALQMEGIIRRQGAIPATVAMIDGRLRVGLTAPDIERLGTAKGTEKLGVRDLPFAATHPVSGGTTVAATMHAAHRAGIFVFATGGIGGVHKEDHFDESADLRSLASTPMMVVCSGAKAILDLSATLERLETLSVPVVGYGTDELPAFYSRTSGLKVSGRVNTPEEVAALWAAHRQLRLESAILIVNPIPQAREIPISEVEGNIESASKEAVYQGITGKALTPFLLQHIARTSNQRTIEANVALLTNNAEVAGIISIAVSKLEIEEPNHL
ncbi:MAG TPA: pseudouridine-5'-phosphate glycosidase [Anaerolineales bacterium]